MSVFEDILDIPVKSEDYMRSIHYSMPMKSKLEKAVKEAVQKHRESLSAGDVVTEFIVKETMQCERWLSDDKVWCNHICNGKVLKVCYCDRVFKELMDELGNP